MDTPGPGLGSRLSDISPAGRRCRNFVSLTLDGTSRTKSRVRSIIRPTRRKERRDQDNAISNPFHSLVFHSSCLYITTTQNPPTATTNHGLPKPAPTTNAPTRPLLPKYKRIITGSKPNSRISGSPTTRLDKLGLMNWLG